MSLALQEATEFQFPSNGKDILNSIYVFPNQMFIQVSIPFKRERHSEHSGAKRLEKGPYLVSIPFKRERHSERRYHYQPVTVTAVSIPFKRERHSEPIISSFHLACNSTVSIPFKRERHSEPDNAEEEADNAEEGFNSLQTGKTF